MVEEDKILEVGITNCAMEINNHMSDWQQRKIDIDLIHHWSGQVRIADLVTMNKITAAGNVKDSPWQSDSKDIDEKERWIEPQNLKQELTEAKVQLA